MAGSVDVVRPAGAWDHQRAALALLVGLGLVLRFWNAGSTRTHDDELHYAEDAMWAVSPLDPGTALSFLRFHPRDHLRLDPRTGALRPWGRPAAGEIARLGHPCLLQYVSGLVIAAIAPHATREAVEIGRRFNAVADAATIVLLPSLAAALGASPAAGLLAGALYAVYPPAVCYGSLDYLDPPLAPLLVLLLVCLLAVTRTGRGWVVLGVVTGLLIGTKQVGLIALVLVPATLLLFGPRDPAGLAIWAGVTLAVVVLFTDPVAYVEGLLNPSRPIGELRLDPVSYLIGNLGLLAQPSAYYWLSFARHGEPLAPLLARVHPVLTPAVQAAFAVGLAAAAVRGAWRRVLVLTLPALLMVSFVLPSDGLWRFHLLSPLVCLGAGLALGAEDRRARLATLGVAVLAGATAFLPARPGADGQLDLGDLVRMNPQARQLQDFHDAEHPLLVQLRPGTVLARQVWLRPGAYVVEVTASAPPIIALDGRRVLRGSANSGDVTVTGLLHHLTVAVPGGGAVETIAIRRANRPG